MKYFLIPVFALLGCACGQGLSDYAKADAIRESDSDSVKCAKPDSSEYHRLLIFRTHPLFTDRSDTDSSFAAFTRTLYSALALKDNNTLLTLFSDSIEVIDGYNQFRGSPKTVFSRMFKSYTDAPWSLINFMKLHCRFGFAPLADLPVSSGFIDFGLSAVSRDRNGSPAVFVNYPFNSQMEIEDCGAFLDTADVSIHLKPSASSKVIARLSWLCGDYGLGEEFDKKDNSSWLLLSFKGGSITGYVNALECTTFAHWMTKIFIVREKKGWRITRIYSPPGC